MSICIHGTTEAKCMSCNRQTRFWPNKQKPNRDPKEHPSA